MSTHVSSSRVRLVRVITLVLATLLPIGLAAPAQADAGRPGDESVTGWAQRHAEPLDTSDPSAPLTDLRHLRRSVGDARIVGLGEGVHGAAEITGLKHRMVRYLVQDLGFRSIAWEEDWSLGVKINRYVRTGKGDLASLIGRMSTAWRTREAKDVLVWLRDYNRSHREDVQFVGVEAYATRPLAYDAVEEYVAQKAPERLAETREHLEVVHPRTEDMEAYVRWYFREVKDKTPYIQHARALHDLVAGLPHQRGDSEYATVLHHTRQIVGFYEQFAAENIFAYRDAHAAENLRWWRRFSGDKIVYWAASGHTANAPTLSLTQPQYPDTEFASVGSFLRTWFGRDYLSVGFTFDRGATISEGQVAQMPAAAPDWLEAPFADVDVDQFTLDLRAKASRPVRDWLRSPTRTRGVPEGGHGSYLSGGTPAEWFDVIVHRQVVTAAHPG